MNSVVESSDSRIIRVYRGEEELTSGSAYHPSEALSVGISDTNNQYVYEAIGGAIFEKGGCDGKRIANKPRATLSMPASGLGPIKIVAGFLLKCALAVNSLAAVAYNHYPNFHALLNQDGRRGMKQSALVPHLF